MIRPFLYKNEIVDSANDLDVLMGEINTKNLISGVVAEVVSIVALPAKGYLVLTRVSEKQQEETVLWKHMKEML